MDVDNENIEPVTTDLGLSLGFSDHNLPRRLNNNLGAGANADMTLVATDPLAELVWSPKNGPSLKCTEYSFHEKKYTCLWAAESSHIVLSPQIIAAGRPYSEKRSNSILGVHMLDNNLGALGLEQKEDMDNSFPEEMNMKGEMSLQHFNEIKDLEQYMRGCASTDNNQQETEMARDVEKELAGSLDESNRCVEQVDPLISHPVNGALGVSGESKIIGIQDFLASEFQEKNLILPGGEKESRLELSEKEEATAENDFPVLVGETSKTMVSEPAFEAEINLEQDVKTIPKQTVSSQHSPTKKSKLLVHQRKGKEKALSEEEDDSHESVESSSSIGLFSSRKRRCDFDQQLIVESKRIKKQSQSGPDSSAFSKQDSSFMTWISNMMKGFLNSKAEKPFAHTVSHRGHDSLGKDLVRYDEQQNPADKNVGFQSMFQSIYCPKKKVQGTRTLDENQTFDVDAAVVEATPIACHGGNINFRKLLLLPNERFKGSTSGGIVDPTTEVQISPVDFAGDHRNSSGSSTENRSSFNALASARKDGKSRSSSLGRRKVMSTENIDSDIPSESKIPRNKTDPLRNLWIARFALKASGPLLNQEDSNRISGGVIECFTDSMKLVPCLDNDADLSDDLKNVEARQQHVEEPNIEQCVADAEVSIGFESVTFHNDQKWVNNLNPIVPSTRFQNSDEMASLFAKRLDALKHIMPAGMSEDGAPAIITCFFCGTNGHHLKHCPEITDTELEELVKNMNPHNGVEELPCVCIRCFQVDHWAVSCPDASSIGQHQFRVGASMADENQKASASCTVLDGTEIGTETNPNNVTAADKMILSTNVNRQYEASCSRENVNRQYEASCSRENQIPLFGNFINQQVSDVPKRVFDAIRMLRLSRIDVFKWMNSPMPITQLDGFYLRLRLGKWEEVLGRTGYYVACITGAHRHDSQKNPKYSISVNVGGIKCFVESQYISNQDFLEDELMAWWHATTRNGDKIPSEQELKRKVKERMMLREE